MSELNLEIQSSDSKYLLHRRFDRMARLIGDEKMQKLFATRVMVIGLGGVGSWAAESLARSGVGTIDLVDFDDICVTNTNRQLPALAQTIGKKKAEVLAERLYRINPQVKVNAHIKFFNNESKDELLALHPDFIVDAIDNVFTKCQLIAEARQRKLRLVTCMGSAGKMDPTQIQVKDLSLTELDPLAAAVRKMLRSEFDFPSEGKVFGIPAVFSKETMIAPYELNYDKGLGFKCVCPQGQNNFHSCERRNVIYGSASFVTGSFGLIAASLIVRHVTEGGQWPS